MALVALSHLGRAPALYLDACETAAQEIPSVASTKTMAMTIRSSGTARRGLEGLIVKLSIERQGMAERKWRS
jgi:hypothetical protein